MANLTAQTTQVTGTTLTEVTPAASGGDTVPVGSRVLIKNGSASAITVTITTPGNDQYGNARPDIVTNVAAGADTLFGPFPLDLADPITGLVTIAVSLNTSIKMAVVAF